MKLVKEYLNEKFEEEKDPIHSMDIGPQGIVYRCGNCGDILDDNHNHLPEGEELEHAKLIINTFGENSDRIKYVYCNNCFEEERVADYTREREEDYRREMEREREYNERERFEEEEERERFW